MHENVIDETVLLLECKCKNNEAILMLNGIDTKRSHFILQVLKKANTEQALNKFQTL